MYDNMPSLLLEKLKKQYNQETINQIIKGYTKERFTTIRVNELKISCKEVLQILEKNNYLYQPINWYNKAFIIFNKNKYDLQELEIYQDGSIYLQSLSSMLPVLILKANNNDHILDMAAAPGSKTTQIAIETKNKARITACEKNKIRAQRLEYNLKKQGVTCTTILKEDATKLDNLFTFDKILLDAPCSGSGTINLKNKVTFTQKWFDKIKKTQLELLRKALTILKPNQTMIYSTCSILQEENEDIINQIKKEFNIEILPINLDIDNATFLPTSIPNTICLCPNEYFEGFFIAKIKKL